MRKICTLAKWHMPFFCLISSDRIYIGISPQNAGHNDTKLKGGNERMNKNKLVSLALAGVMGIGLLAGCTPAATTPTPGPSAPVESGAPAQPSTGAFNMNVCIASEPQTIDPALNSSVDGAVMTQHIFEGLMKWGNSGELAADDLNVNRADLVLGQAKEMPAKVTNDDGTVTYTFILRDDAKWSDGKAVTAGDFVYAWKRAVNPNTAADYSNMFQYIVGYNEVMDLGAVAADAMTASTEAPNDAALKEAADAANAAVLEAVDQLAVKAVDEKTLEVVLYTDTPYFLELCAFPTYLPLREDIISVAGDQWTFSPDTYIGNGAYKMTEWTHNSKIVMAKNDQYYDYANLGPDTITFTLTDDDNAMLAGYRSGELNFVEEVPVDEIAGLIASGDYRIAPYLGTYYVCYQNQKAPFDDWRVRKAFTLAIDSKFIVEQVTQAGQVPAYGWVPSGISDATPGSDFREAGGALWNAPNDEATYKANLEEANRLLDEAGYTDRTTFPTVEYLYNTSDAHKAVGEALQSQWQTGLGVTVTLRNQEWGTFLETRKQGDYQIARNGWINDYNDAMGFLDMWVTGGGNNDAQYKNPDYDAAIKEANATSDPSARMDAMHRAEDMLMSQDWALGPIYFYTRPYMLSQGVNDVFYTPLGYFFFQYATQG